MLCDTYDSYTAGVRKRMIAGCPTCERNASHDTYHVAHDTYHVAHDTYHVAHDTYHVAHDTYHAVHSPVPSVPIRGATEACLLLYSKMASGQWYYGAEILLLHVFALLRLTK